MPETPRDEIARLQEEYEKNPEGRLFVHLAEAYRRSGDLEKAREILTEGLARHSDYLSARIVLAQVETELGASGRAKAVWREVIQLDPDNELALWALAELEYNEGNAAEALGFYRRLAELGVDDAELDEMIALLESTLADSGGSADPRDAAFREPVGAAVAGSAPEGRPSGPAPQDPRNWDPRSAAEAGAGGSQPKERGASAGTPPSRLTGAAGTTPSEAGPTGGQAGAATSGGGERAEPAAGRRGASDPASRPADEAPDRAGGGSEQVGRRNQNGNSSLVQTDAIGLSDLLIRLLEYRDATFHAGSSLTRLLAVSIGRELELERIHLEALALAALLSDLGAQGLGGDGRSLAELSDPNERRNAEQREVAVSLQLLQGITLPAGVHEAVRHQHERWDGKGYPDGLREEEIPYGARVIAIARACAAHLTGIDDGAGVAAALDELQRNAGSRYDPVVVNVLRRVFQKRSEHGIGFGLGGRVVVVTPEELRALGVASQLHSEGYVAEVARETTRARAAVRKGGPKAVVLGAGLPSEDLTRFIRDLRSSPEASGTPLIVIDANDSDLRVDLLTAGADVCFASEVSFREFKATLDALLRRREEIERPSDRGGRIESRF